MLYKTLSTQTGYLSYYLELDINESQELFNFGFSGEGNNILQFSGINGRIYDHNNVFYNSYTPNSTITFSGNIFDTHHNYFFNNIPVNLQAQKINNSNIDAFYIDTGNSVSNFTLDIIGDTPLLSGNSPRFATGESSAIYSLANLDSPSKVFKIYSGTLNSFDFEFSGNQFTGQEISTGISVIVNRLENYTNSGLIEQTGTFYTNFGIVNYPIFMDIYFAYDFLLNFSSLELQTDTGIYDYSLSYGLYNGETEVADKSVNLRIDFDFISGLNESAGLTEITGYSPNTGYTWTGNSLITESGYLQGNYFVPVTGWNPYLSQSRNGVASGSWTTGELVYATGNMDLPFTITTSGVVTGNFTDNLSLTIQISGQHLASGLITGSGSLYRAAESEYFASGTWDYNGKVVTGLSEYFTQIQSNTFYATGYASGDISGKLTGVTNLDLDLRALIYSPNGSGKSLNEKYFSNSGRFVSELPVECSGIFNYIPNPYTSTSYIQNIQTTGLSTLSTGFATGFFPTHNFYSGFYLGYASNAYYDGYVASFNTGWSGEVFFSEQDRGFAKITDLPTPNNGWLRMSAHASPEDALEISGNTGFAVVGNFNPPNNSIPLSWPSEISDANKLPVWFKYILVGSGIGSSNTLIFEIDYRGRGNNCDYWSEDLFNGTFQRYTSTEKLTLIALTGNGSTEFSVIGQDTDDNIYLSLQLRGSPLNTGDAIYFYVGVPSNSSIPSGAFRLKWRENSSTKKLDNPNPFFSGYIGETGNVPIPSSYTGLTFDPIAPTEKSLSSFLVEDAKTYSLKNLNELYFEFDSDIYKVTGEGTGIIPFISGASGEKSSFTTTSYTGSTGYQNFTFDYKEMTTQGGTTPYAQILCFSGLDNNSLEDSSHIIKLTPHYTRVMLTGRYGGIDGDSSTGLASILNTDLNHLSIKATGIGDFVYITGGTIDQGHLYFKKGVSEVTGTLFNYASGFIGSGENIISTVTGYKNFDTGVLITGYYIDQAYFSEFIPQDQVFASTTLTFNESIIGYYDVTGIKNVTIEDGSGIYYFESGFTGSVDNFYLIGFDSTINSSGIESDFTGNFIGYLTGTGIYTKEFDIDISEFSGEFQDAFYIKSFTGEYDFYTGVDTGNLVQWTPSNSLYYESYSGYSNSGQNFQVTGAGEIAVRVVKKVDYNNNEKLRIFYSGENTTGATIIESS